MITTYIIIFLVGLVGVLGILLYFSAKKERLYADAYTKVKAMNTESVNRLIKLNNDLIMMTSKAVKLEQELTQIKTSRSASRTRVDFDDLRVPSNITVEEAEAFLSDCDIRLLENAHVFVEAERTFGVNALVLMAMARHESGNGDYPYMAQNNCFSWKGDGPGGYGAFATLELCIRYVASRLGIRMNESGDVSLTHLQHNIWKPADQQWADKVKDVIRGEGYGVEEGR